MRRVTRLLLWVVGLLIAVWSGVMLFLRTLDAEIYRRALERELTSLLARQVSISALTFDVSLRPTLVARDLSIANPQWASRPQFATAAGAKVRIDLVALWHGHVDLRAVHLQGLDLLLERNAEGAGNWQMGTPDDDDSSANLPDFDAVSLADARIAWRSREGAIWEARVDSAEATIRDGAPFEVRAQGVYRDAPVALWLKGDVSLQAALNGSAWQVTGRLDPRGAQLEIDARLPAGAALDGAEVALEAQGERLDAWTPLVQRALPAWGPYRVSARVRNAQSGVQVDALRLSLHGLPMQPSRIEIESGNAEFGEAVQTRFSARGKLGEAPFSLEASSEPPAKWTRAGGALPLAARAQLADLELAAQGTLALGPTVPEFDLALTARGDALAPARVFAGTPLRHPLPVNLSARVAHAADRFALDGIRGRVLGCSVTGDLAYTVAPRRVLTGSLTLGRLDLAQPAIAALRAGGRGSAAPGPDTPPAWLQAFDADLALRAAAIDGLPFPARNLAARVQLHAGALTLQGASATLANIDLAGDATLRWSGSRPQVDASVRIAVLDAARLRGSGARAGDAANAPLPLDPLRALDGTLQLTVERIAGLPAPIAALTAHASLRRGKLAVEPLALAVARVPVRGRVVLDATGAAWRVQVDAQAPRVDVAGLLRALERPATASGRIEDVQLTLETQGASLRSLLAQAKLRLHSDAFALKTGREHAPIEVKRAAFEAAPGGPLRMFVVGTALGAPMDLAVTGGPLAELLQPERAWPKLRLEMRTALRGEFLHLVATTGPLQRVIGMREVPVAVEAALPGAKGVFEGTIDELDDPAGTPLTGRIEVASLAQAGALFGQDGLPDLPLVASGRIILGEGEVSFDELSLQAGKSDAQGRLRVRWEPRPAISADLGSKLIDTTQWTVASRDEVAFLERRIPVQSLLARDAQLHVRAERLVLPHYDLARVDLTASLDKGVLDFAARAAEGDLHGELRFDARKPVPAVAVRLSLREFETQTLYTAAADRSGAPTPLVSVRTQLAASGVTPREILATSQGEMLVTAGAGKVPMESSYGFERLAGNLLLTLVPGRKTEDFSQLQCAAARFSIANGVATSADGIALRFEQLDILGGGAINLSTGGILFGYRAVRRNWLSFSIIGLTSGLARVSGTIGEPRVELDPSGVLIQGTAAWATAGISLLAGDLWRKLESTGDPCARIASGARPSSDPLDLLIGALPVRLPASAPASR